MRGGDPPREGLLRDFFIPWRNRIIGRGLSRVICRLTGIVIRRRAGGRNRITGFLFRTHQVQHLQGDPVSPAKSVL